MGYDDNILETHRKTIETYRKHVVYIGTLQNKKEGNKVRMICPGADIERNHRRKVDCTDRQFFFVFS